MICPKCENTVADTAIMCKWCGVSFVDHSKDQPAQTVIVMDNSSIGFAFLSFLIPWVGLILWGFWRKDTPRKAKSCLKGAGISIIIFVLLIVLVIIVISNP